MKMTYDKVADALYIRLLDGDYECRVVQLTDNITLDFVGDQQLVGIEVLGASQLFDKPDAPEIELQDLLPKMVTV